MIPHAILAALVRTQRAQFALLAQSWLEAGATAFEIWSNNKMIGRWATSHDAAVLILSATIGESDDQIGELRVYGTGSALERVRLEADSAMIEQQLQLESELQSMTADLVATQDQLVAMYQLSQSLRSHVTVEETLQSVVVETARMARARAGFAVLLRPDGTPLVVQHPPESVDDTIVWQTFWQAHANERDVLLPDDIAPQSLPSGVENLFFTPIRIRGALNAGLGLVNKFGEGFTAPDIKLIHAITQQASAHIENVLLYQDVVEQTKLQTEIELAQRVQLQLQPQRLPNIQGLDIYANSRPASQVGGDFYDFVDRRGRPFTFMVGDVAGKGLSAALLMTMTRSAIHSKARFMPNPTPEMVMRNSNEDLYDDFTQVGMFATVFIGQYVASQRQLMYANAGHSPVIYRSGRGKSVLLQADSTPMGVLNISMCRNHAVAMEPGDLMIVATDGFSEMRNGDDEMFGYERLLQLANANAHKSARAITDALFDAITQFGGGRLQDDDQTLVVIKGV